MPSSMYLRLTMAAGDYVDKATVEGAIQRQFLAGTTPDSFSATDLKALNLRITTALKLYVSDTGKRAEMIAKIQALC